MQSTHTLAAAYTHTQQRACSSEELERMTQAGARADNQRGRATYPDRVCARRDGNLPDPGELRSVEAEAKPPRVQQQQLCLGQTQLTQGSGVSSKRGLDTRAG
eukprot:2452153-Rhodomonas_salina.1